jgi:hypothetical protein
MRFYLIRRKLQFYWKKKSVRAIAVSLVLSVTLLVQYVLANRPEPLQIETRGNMFTIPDISPGQKLVLEGLAADSSNSLLLTHVGNPKEEVDAHFSNARLAPGTLREFEESHPPTSAGEIDCSPVNRELSPQSESQPETAKQPAPTAKDTSRTDGKACSTSIIVRVAARKDNSASLSFYQTEMAGREHYRHLVMNVRDLEVTVKLKMVPPVSLPQPDAGCGKYLTVLDWHQYLGGPAEVESIMTAGSTLRLRFTPFADGALSPVDKDGLFEPFFFGTSGQPTNNVNAAIQSRSVSIRSMDDKKVFFQAESADGKSLISFDTLQVGADRMRVDMRGEAYVTVNDVPVTVDLFELVRKKSWFITGLLTMANAAILTWIVKVLRGLFS